MNIYYFINFFYYLIIFIQLIWLIPYIIELYIIFIFIMYVNIVKCLKGIYDDMYTEIKDHIYIINHKYHNIYTYYKRKYYK